MKAYKREQTVDIFKPIEVIVTFESEEEVQELWHRLDISSESIGKAVIADRYNFHSIVDGIDLLKSLRYVLGECMKERNIKA